MPNTTYTKKLEERRNSREVQDFKRRVLDFLNSVNATEEVKYSLRSDLAAKIDMPFYRERGNRVGRTLSAEELAKEYIHLLIDYNNYDFSVELLRWLFKQQNQTLRKLHRRHLYQKERKQKIGRGVWEHPVPSCYSCNKILGYIKSKDKESADAYIHFLSEKVPQVFLSVEEDKAVNRLFRDSMPADWNWETDSPFVRYERAQLDKEVYKN